MADANVLVAAYLRDSTVRRIVLLANLELLAPEFIFEEFDKHLAELAERAGLAVEGSKDLLARLKARFVTVPPELVASKLREAEEAMEGIDPRDAPYLACALCVPCDGIWSDDPHMKEQDLVPGVTTKELLERLRREGFPYPP